MEISLENLYVDLGFKGLKKPLLILQSSWREIQNASGNSLSPQNKDIGVASQTLLTEAR